MYVHIDFPTLFDCLKLLLTEDKKHCNCPVCNGELLSKKTIKRHLEAFKQKQGGHEQTNEDISTTYYEGSFATGPLNTSQSMLQSGNPFASTSDISNTDCTSKLSKNSDSDMADSRRLSECSQNDSPLPSDVDDNHCDDHETVDVGDDNITDFVLRALLSKVNYA